MVIMINVRAFRRAYIASDHQHVIAKLKIKTARALKLEQSVNTGHAVTLTFKAATQILRATSRLNMGIISVK